MRLAAYAHVFVRTDELRLSEWSEFNFEERLWRIPGTHENAPTPCRSACKPGY